MITTTRRLLALAAMLALLAGCTRPTTPGRATTEARPPHRAWRWTPPAPDLGMPAADRDAVAVSAGATFLALVGSDGRSRWVARRLGLRDVPPSLTPALVLAATDDGVAAFDRATGAPRWDVSLGDRAATPVLAGGRVVVSLWDGALAALDAATGALVWRVPLPGLAIGPPATDGRTVVVTWERLENAGAGLTAVDVASGAPRWSAALPPGGVSGPAVVGDTVVVVAGDRAARAFDAGTGAQRWRTEVASAGSPEVTPTAAPGGVLVVTRLAGVHLLDIGTGARRRTVRPAGGGAAVRARPVVGPHGRMALPLWDGRLLLAGAPGALGRLDATATPWTVAEPPGVVSGVALAPPGRLVVTTRGGEHDVLTAYDW